MSFSNRSLRRGPLIAIMLWGFLWVYCAGCASKEETQEDIGSSSAALLTLLEKNSHDLEEFPHHPQAEEILGQFVIAAKPLAKAEGQDPLVYLMYQFPSNNLGLYCLDRVLETGDYPSPDAKLSFCAEIQHNAPRTPVALAALSHELRILAAAEDTRFRERCNEILSVAERTDEVRIALYTRAQYFVGRNQPKDAALDLLKFWAWFPDQLKAMDAIDSTLATISNAGFFFEASALSVSNWPEKTAQFFLDDFGAASTNSLEEACGNVPGSVAQHLRPNPDVDKLEAATSPNAGKLPGNREWALQSLRLASLHTVRHQWNEVVESYEAAVKCLQEFAAEKTLDSHDSLALVDCCWSALESLRKADLYLSSLDDRTAGLPIREVQKKSSTLTLPLADCYLEFARRSALGQQDQGPAILRAAVENFVAVALRLNDRKRAPQAYRLFVETFPDSSAAPEMLITLGDLLKSKYNLKVQATDVYREVEEKYPNSAQRITAKWKLSVALYEMENYPQAHEACLAIVAESSDSSQVDSAQLMAAICELAMGQPDLAEEHLQEFCKMKPQSPLVPKAMLLLATQALSAQEYEKANTHLQDLTKKYPETSEAVTAKEYLAKLANLNKDANGL